MTVTVTITGGPSTNVTWTQGMNAQQALELAEDNLGKQLLFSIEYYGSQLGYLVNMINETYDTFKSSAHPYFYWEFFVNNTPATHGIDQTILQDGDSITFTYTAYTQSSPSPTAQEKHNRRAH